MLHCDTESLTHVRTTIQVNDSDHRLKTTIQDAINLLVRLMRISKSCSCKPLTRKYKS